MVGQSVYVWSVTTSIHFWPHSIQKTFIAFSLDYVGEAATASKFFVLPFFFLFFFNLAVLITLLSTFALVKFCLLCTSK